VSERTKNPYLAARAKLEAELRWSGLPYTVARPSFITGPDRDESRPLERGGAAVADAMLKVAGLVGARGVADRYRSIRGSTLAEALVTVALDPAQQSRALTADQLRAALRRR
jgi:uncharacterized protein YbjT (DUF2867 family)